MPLVTLQLFSVPHAIGVDDARKRVVDLLSDREVTPAD